MPAVLWQEQRCHCFHHVFVCYLICSPRGGSTISLAPSLPYIYWSGNVNFLTCNSNTKATSFYRNLEDIEQSDLFGLDIMILWVFKQWFILIRDKFDVFRRSSRRVLFHKTSTTGRGCSLWKCEGQWCRENVWKNENYLLKAQSPRVKERSKRSAEMNSTNRPPFRSFCTSSYVSDIEKR